MQHVAGVLQNSEMPQLATGDETGNATVEIELLKLKLEHAEGKLSIEENRRRESEQREREAREEITRLLNIVEKQTYLLTAGSAQETQKENLPSQPKRGWWRRIFD